MARLYKLSPEQESILLEIVASDGFAAMAETQAELKRRTGLEVHDQTVLKALMRLGVERLLSAKVIQSILNVFPPGGYKKVVHEPLIARNIGLSVIREECPQFDVWVKKLEAWGTLGYV